MVACGDDSSSVFPDSCAEPCRSTVGDLPSSSAESDDAPDSSGDRSSSSSVKSSSSAKSSSSTDAKSSSSVTSSSSGPSEYSSSLSKKYQCLAECTEDCEGETYWIGTDHQMICHGGQWLNLDSMENANRSSSSRYYDMTEQFNPDVEYGEFTDPRDGQTYRTISMYDGSYYTDSLVFFAENLNFGKMVPGGTVQGDSSKYCYDDDPWYCENGWGGLYTWSAAMNIPSICDSVKLGSEQCPYKFRRDEDGIKIDGEVIHQGLCPEGWHIANDGEWAYLAEKSGGGSSLTYEMGSKVAYFGSKNKYGLSILPAGYLYFGAAGGKRYEGITKQTNYWMALQSSNDAKEAMTTWMDSQHLNRGIPALKSGYALSIRCVKNY